jgi:hypothetical protein
MTDFRGEPLSVGDHVAVGNRHSSTMWLDEREVVGFSADGVPILKSSRATRKYAGRSYMLVKL